MHLSNSTAPSDSTLLVALFPGAAPASNGTPPSAAPPDGCAAFDQLFPDLAPAATASTALTEEAAALAASLAGLTTTTSSAATDGSTVLTGELRSEFASELEASTNETQTSTESDSETAPEKAARPAFRLFRASSRSTLIEAKAPSTEELSVRVNAGTPSIDTPFLPTPGKEASAATAFEISPSKDSSAGVGEQRPQFTPPGFARVISARDFVSHGLTSNEKPALASEAESAGKFVSTPLPEPGSMPASAAPGTESLGAAECFSEAELPNLHGRFLRSAEPGKVVLPSEPSRVSESAEIESASVDSLPARSAISDFAPAGSDALPNGARDVAQVSSERGLGNTSSQAEAKFAATRFRNLSAAKTTENDAEKTFVASEDEDVKPHRQPLGIDVAKSASTMFARFLPTPSQHSASEHAAAGVATGGAAEFVVSPKAEVLTPESVSSAHEAVEVVLHAADQVSSREQTSVNLQFSVGDAELSVRVELQGDEVRTTFRTESAELRAALSQEWQAVANSSSGSAVRIAPAVFTASEQSALNAFAGDASSRQRDPNTQPGSSERAAAAISRARASASSAATLPSRAANSSSAASLTSRHLQTVA